MDDERQSKEDRQLREAARRAQAEAERERRRFDERWDRLAAGELSEDELAELRELAERDGDAARAWEAFRPLEPSFRRRMVATAERRLASGEPEGAPAASRSGTPGPLARLWEVARAYRTPLAVATTALALVVLTPIARQALDGESPGTWPPLPGYAAELAGGVASARGPGERPGRDFPADSELVLLLRPSEPVAGPIAARLYVDRGGELTEWPLPAELSETGSVRFVGRVGGTLGRAGALVVVVGRPGALPEPAELVRRRGDGAEEDSGPWVALRVEIPRSESPGG